MNIVIIGGGKGETSTLQTLAEAISIKILGIIATPDDEDTIKLAEAFDIPIISDCPSLFKNNDIDLILDLSDSGDT